jgi:hypothetical protein
LVVSNIFVPSSYPLSRYDAANNRFMVWHLGSSLRCRLLLWI